MRDLSRRGFLQSAAFLAGAGGAHALFGAEISRSPIEALRPPFEPRALFLTWQQDPTTTMTIQWIGTDTEGAQRPVSFVPEGLNTWQVATGITKRYPMTDLWIFRSELTGLQPDSEYKFRVGNDSAEYRFRTMPKKATNTVHFVSGGDSGISKAAIATNKTAAAQAPMFVVIDGDLAYENGKDPNTFLQFLVNYSRDLRDAKGRLIPLLVGIGNHEVNGGYGKPRTAAPFYYAVFDGFYKETGYNVLDFGDYLSLIFLDTGHTSPIEGEQTSWLEKTLQEREEFPTVFVFNHVPAYPSVRPAKLPGGIEATGHGNRKHWVPLFERYNVDAVFEHHDHCFKRSHPLLDGMKNENGILYLGDGSWGKIRRPDTPERRPYLALTHEAYHLSVHRIEGNDRYHVALSDSGRVVDVCSTQKRSHRRTK